MNRIFYIRIFTLACIGLGVYENIAADNEILSKDTRAVMSLNGLWDTLPIKGLDFVYPPPEKGWEKEQVPNPNGKTSTIKSGPYIYSGRYNPMKTGKFEKDNGMATWFRHSFQLPAILPENKRAILRFGGMAYRSEVWLNGKKLGRSYQCMIPIEYDVTDIIQSGENDLLVGITGIQGITDLKNKTLLAPAWGTGAGIRGGVELLFIPEVHLEDVFIKTSVKNKKIEVLVNLKNSGKIAKMVIPELTILDPDGTPILQAKGDEIIINPDENKKIVLSKEWIAKRLWNINDPAIYTANIKLTGSDNSSIDSKKQNFGFKEFNIKGRNFYLNGVKTVLFRSSMLSSLGTEPQNSNMYPDVRNKIDNPYNCIRLHLGFNNKYILDGADRFGMMSIPESSWNHTQYYPTDKKALWLPNTLEYYRGWIKENRNRPSIIMWSLCNETYWDKRKPDEMAIAKEIFELVKKLDPTRPQQGDGEVSWNGLLPTINIHYPEGNAGTVKLVYPNSGIVIPNDLHWLKKEGTNKSWRAEFVWDRPLMLGEYWNNGGDVLPNSSFMGDDMFDWEKWRFQKIADPSYSPDNAYIETLQKATDWYRKLGVACFNPWAGNRKIFLKAVDVRPLDFHPNFPGAQTGIRKAIVFNDSFQNYAYMHLQCDLKVADTTVWKNKIKINVPMGTNKELDIPIKFPEVRNITKAKLAVRLRYWRAGGWRELARFEEDVYIMPKTDFKNLETEKIVLYDPSGNTSNKLETIGLNLKAYKSLSNTILKDARLVIIGDNSSPYKYGGILEDFIKNGGRAIILQQKNWRPFLNELPASDTKHVASQSWFRSFKHPVFRGTFEKQFSYWRPDNLISVENFWKPSNGNFTILLDNGGRYGMCWTPLLTLPLGKGEFILSQLNIISALGKEPMAAYLLKNIITYSLQKNNKILKPLRLFPGTNKALKDALEMQNVIFTEGIAGDGPILIDGSADISSENMKYLSEYLKNGGVVWLHDFTPETAGKIAQLLPFKLKLKAPDKTVKSATRRSRDKLINSLASFDFLWTTIDAGGRADYFQLSKATAELGDFVLDVYDPSLATPLLAPAFFVKIPIGKGKILFDTLKWENAITYEADKVGRVISALISNVGGLIIIKPEKEYNYFFVDLKSHANMGYYDKISGDKKGGWTDQGENDMRFFLINHTGRAGGREDGMPISTEPFPSKVRLAKKPFKLVVPNKNNDKAVISLQGGTHGEFLPKNIDGILVGKKADTLYFLQTACWVQVIKQNNKKMAEYIIHYQDGGTESFPIRIGIEIGDWWNPAPMPKAVIAWTGMNLMHSPIGIWMTVWKNPYPDKVIESIDLKGNFEPSQLVLLAVTGGVETRSDAGEKLSKWDFTQFQNGIVKNEIVGMPSLKSDEKKPSPSQDKNMPGLLFRNGQSMTANSKIISGFLDGNPFKLSVQLTPLEKPKGYYGGIFQCGQYKKTGFRLMLQRQSMKLLVEIFPSPDNAVYLTSKTPLKLGHKYKVDLIFKNGKTSLFLNNKLDSIVETNLPAPCEDNIRIGTASGKDYNFNGIIKEILIYGEKS